jgi:hypothetical protein
LLQWRAALAYRRNELSPNTPEAADGLAAMYILGLIGITGEPPDPAIDFGQLGDVDPAFLSGSVQPMTVRNIISLLIAQLPKPELEILRAITDLAVNSECAISGDSDFVLQKRNANSHLMRVASPLLDSYPDAPLYYIHLNASQRRIVEDVEVYVRGLKERRSIPERRTRISEFEDYLKIWDLREGWRNGKYDTSGEWTLAQIGKELSLSKSTAATAYRAAFKRIIGHEFTHELWIRVMGLIKVPDRNIGAVAKLQKRYHNFMSSNAPKPIPESMLQSDAIGSHNTGLLETQTAIYDDSALLDLTMDASELIERGLSDAEIASKLEINDPSWLGYLRGRINELCDSQAPREE